MGDNINYNLRVLNVLYKLRESLSNDYQKSLLCKPIIVTIVSIIEAILYDFHSRIKINTIEGVNNLSQSVINCIRNKKIDQFEALIISAKKHNFFDVANNKFYDDLELLRKVRNRVHIQNHKGYEPSNEEQAFPEDCIKSAELTLEKIIKVMNAKFPRAENTRGYVSDFILPWNEKLVLIKQNKIKYTMCPYCLFANIDDGSGYTMCWCGKLY